MGWRAARAGRDKKEKKNVLPKVLHHSSTSQLLQTSVFSHTVADNAGIHRTDPTLYFVLSDIQIYIYMCVCVCVCLCVCVCV